MNIFGTMRVKKNLSNKNYLTINLLNQLELELFLIHIFNEVNNSLITKTWIKKKQILVDLLLKYLTNF